MSGELSPNGRVDAHVVPAATGRAGTPCDPCSSGDHQRCFAAYCWGCDGHHRKHGIGQPVAGPLRGGMPEDDQ